MLKLVSIAVAAAVAGTGQVGPAELLVPDVPDGLEIAVEPPIDLTFDEYAPLSPDATAHVDPTGPVARSMRAAVDVWTSIDEDVLLREVTRWATEDDAQAFVEQAVVVGVNAGLDPADAPFDGGVAHIGAERGLWTRTLAWRQGTYAMAVSHFAIVEGSEDVIDEAALALATAVEDATGQPIEDAGGTAERTTSSSDSGIGIFPIVLWLAVVAGLVWLYLRTRRQRSQQPTRGHTPETGNRNPREPARDVDGD